jgi:glutamate dehydrogenase
MHQAYPEQHRKILSSVSTAAARLPRTLRGRLSQLFLRAYYANVATLDLADREPRQLAAIASSQLLFARRRRGRALVRVFNPTLREHGYTSAHTVVEMVNDDMPFLVDSIGLVIAQRSLTLHFLAHPIFAVTRDAAGNLQSLEERGQPSGGKKLRLESFQHIEVDRIVDPTILKALHADIERSMRDVRVACMDWARMQKAAGQTADDLNALGSRFDPRDVAETQALLGWMENRHFMFLGYREYRLKGTNGKETLEPVEQSGLGILRPGHKHPESTSRILASDIRRQARSLHRAPRGFSRLHRREAFRTQGTVDRRTALPRLVDLGRVQHQPARHPAGAPQDRATHPALRPRTRQS